MSLTRKQWEEMWDEIRLIERVIMKIDGRSLPTKSVLMATIKKVKDKIESVVGQME
jgi:hypothetical protein